MSAKISSPEAGSFSNASSRFALLKLPHATMLLLTDQSVNSNEGTSSFENEQSETWRE